MNYINIEHDYSGQLYDETLYMYHLFCEQSFPQEIRILDGFQNLINTLYEAHHQDKPKIITHEMPSLIASQDKSKILIGFSGGLDTAYDAFYFNDLGYDVTLMHIKNLNKAYPLEDIFAQKFAQHNGFNYKEYVAKHYQKEFFIDNPLKNQLVLSVMVDYGLHNNINIYNMGSGSFTSIKDSRIGMTITDSIEVNQLFWNGVNKYIENVCIHPIPTDTRKIDKLKYFLEHHPNVLNDIYSCISPHRFNASLRERNEKKYNVKLLNGRCGSCFKCCMEAILLAELNYYDKNSEFINHCWDILAKSKNSHRKDLFDKKKPLQERYNNIINYG